MIAPDAKLVAAGTASVLRLVIQTEDFVRTHTLSGAQYTHCRIAPLCYTMSSHVVIRDVFYTMGFMACATVVRCCWFG